MGGVCSPLFLGGGGGGGGGLPFFTPIFQFRAAIFGPFLHGKMLNFGPLHGKMHFAPPPFPRGKMTFFDTLKNGLADLPRDVHFWGGGRGGGYPPWTPHGFFNDDLTPLTL